MFAEIRKQAQDEWNIFPPGCNLTAACVWLEAYLPPLLQSEGMP